MWEVQVLNIIFIDSTPREKSRIYSCLSLVTCESHFNSKPSELQFRIIFTHQNAYFEYKIDVILHFKLRYYTSLFNKNNLGISIEEEEREMSSPTALLFFYNSQLCALKPGMFNFSRSISNVLFQMFHVRQKTRPASRTKSSCGHLGFNTNHHVDMY